MPVSLKHFTSGMSDVDFIFWYVSIRLFWKKRFYLILLDIRYHKNDLKTDNQYKKTKNNSPLKLIFCVCYTTNIPKWIELQHVLI